MIKLKTEFEVINSIKAFEKSSSTESIWWPSFNDLARPWIVNTNCDSQERLMVSLLKLSQSSTMFFFAQLYAPLFLRDSRLHFRLIHGSVCLDGIINMAVSMTCFRTAHMASMGVWMVFLSINSFISSATWYWRAPISALFHRCIFLLTGFEHVWDGRQFPLGRMFHDHWFQGEESICWWM